jgi:phosphate-selective porin OprO/OprP
MRFTWLPWYDEATEGRGLFHVGANYSYREVADQGIRFRGTPGSHLAGNVADTTGIDNIMDYQLFGAEMAWVYGPLSVQSEYIAAYTNRSAGLVEPQYDGVYVQASYFLTGEHRPYKRGRGIFGRVKPFENFFRVRTCDGDVVTGLGAWEVAYRYSYADMLHPGVADSRRLGDHSLGLNWYLSPYTRLMFNYINADANQQGLAGTGNIDIYQMRAQIDF